MAYNSNILLGRITKISGYEGTVAVRLEKSFIENIPPMESVFLEIDGRPVPFFISGYDYSGADILKLSFEGYESVEKISEFTGCRVFLTSADNGEPDNEDISYLTGYAVLNTDNVIIGEISGVIQNPGQWLLSVNSPANKEILIPFHEDFIVMIDDDKRIMQMDIPDGLIELN